MKKPDKNEMLKKGTNYANYHYDCECGARSWLAVDIGWQSTNYTLFFFHLVCLDCGEYMDTDSIRMEKFQEYKMTKG